MAKVGTHQRAASELDIPSAHWTVMVFMGADGVEGNISLAQAAADDIAEMNRVGQSPRLDIFYQVHGDGTPRRGHIGRGDATRVPSDQQDVVSGEALAHFIRWALHAVKPPPTAQNRYTILILWGHAYRFGIGHTQTKAGIDAIDFAELADVFQTLQEERVEQNNRGRLDIVAFDCCDLATVEMCVQLEVYADYLLASQIGIPLPGWPYDRILSRLKTPLGREMGPAEFGAYAVRRFCDHYYAEDKKVSLTLLDLKRAPEVSARAEVLALRLIEAIREPDERRLIGDLMIQAQTDVNKPFIDVATFCLALIRHSNDVFVRTAAESLGNLLLSPPPSAAAGQSREGARRPIVAEHGRNTALTANLNGLSLYAPHIAAGHDWEGASYWYKKFAFVQESFWSSVVHAFVRR